jgi:hypothetical protein
MLLHTRTHMMHVRPANNPADFTIDPAMLNPWADPAVGKDDALRYVLATGSLYGSPSRVRARLPSCAMPACSTCCARIAACGASTKLVRPSESQW